jgi:hypothetical protein
MLACKVLAKTDIYQSRSSQDMIKIPILIEDGKIYSLLAFGNVAHQLSQTLETGQKYTFFNLSQSVAVDENGLHSYSMNTNSAIRKGWISLDYDADDESSDHPLSIDEQADTSEDKPAQEEEEEPTIRF